MPDADQGTRRRPFLMVEVPGHGPACTMALGPAEAPPLIFLHGFGGDLLTWQYCLGAFAGRFRVLALDLPGHGRSSAHVGSGDLRFMVDWLDAVLAMLDLGPAHLVGHSMGAKIAIGLALGVPERVASLSLIAPAGLGGPFDRDLLHDFLDCTSEAAADDLASRLLGSASSHLAAGLARSLRMAGGPARAQALGRLLGDEAMIGAGFSADGIVPWSRIACAKQIIWGRDDTILPLADAHRLPPDADFVVLDGIGHLPQLECPTRLITLIDRFLP